MVAETAVERHHKVVLGIHAGALYKPGDVRSVERRRHVTSYNIVSRTGGHGLFQGGELRLEGTVAMPAGIVQHAFHGRSAEICGMCVAKSREHTVGKEVLRRCKYCLIKHRQLLEKVDAGTLFEVVGEGGKLVQHGNAVSGRLVPDARLRVEAEVCQFLHAPLAHAVAVGHATKVVLPALLVGIVGIVLQHKCYFSDEPRLEQVPVVVGHSVVNDVVGPLLESRLIHVAAILYIVSEQGVNLRKLVYYVLVDYLERLHADDCQSVSAVHVLGDVAVIYALHVHVEHAEGRPCIAFVARGLVQPGGIARNSDNAAVYAGDVAASLRGVRLFHLAGQLAYICHAAGLVVIVRHKVFGSRSVVCRLRSARAGELDGGHRRLASARTAELLAVNEHIGGMRRPVHLQARVEPVGLFLHTFHVLVNLGFQLFGLAWSRICANEHRQHEKHQYQFPFHRYVFYSNTDEHRKTRKRHTEKITLHHDLTF